MPCASTASTSAGDSPALASACRITRCCDGPFGAVRPLDAPSWLTAEPRTTASTGWPLRRASESRSSSSTPDALGPAGAVRRRRRTPCTGRPAASPRCRVNSTNVPGRGHHRRRRRPAPVEHSPCRSACAARCSATSDDEQAVSTVTAGPSRPRVYDDPAGHDAAGAAGARGSPRRPRARVAQPRAVVVVHHAGEHAGPAAAQRRRVDARRARAPPRTVSSSSRCCGSIASASRGRDPEEPGVELGRVVQEPALPGVRRARRGPGPGRTAPRGPSRGRSGNAADRVAAVGDQSPQVLRASRPRPGSGRPCRRSRSARRRPRADRRRRRRRRPAAPSSSLAQVLGERGRGRVVEDQRGGQPQPGRRVRAGCAARPRSASRSPARVNARSGSIAVGAGVAEDGGDLRRGPGRAASRAARAGQAGQPAGQRVHVRAGGGGPAGRAPDQSPQQRRRSAGSARSAAVSSRAATRSAVARGQRRRRTAPGPHRRRSRRSAATAIRRPVGLAQMPGHPAGLFPQPPRQRRRRQALPPGGVTASASRNAFAAA